MTGVQTCALPILAPLQLVNLPVQFGAYVLVADFLDERRAEQGAVEAADDIEVDVGGILGEEAERHSLTHAVTQGASLQFVKAADGAVEDGAFADAVHAAQDVHVGAQIPGDVLPAPEALYLDAPDVFRLFLHVVFVLGLFHKVTHSAGEIQRSRLVFFRCPPVSVAKDRKSGEMDREKMACFLI